MNSKQAKTLERIFDRPARTNIRWRDIESLLLACGAEITEGRGSRVRVRIGDRRADFHRPHPRPETDPAAVEKVGRFLDEVGIKP